MQKEYTNKNYSRYIITIFPAHHFIVVNAGCRWRLGDFLIIRGVTLNKRGNTEQDLQYIFFANA
jgi:hypothetical protein